MRFLKTSKKLVSIVSSK
ncbi:hypothetical protein BpHYR1_038877 [Brachionus plicatilis]|uniref:Uncharacterized protein n=1 Tax=Brachionus plicatilis TaxID=10195 RepID=A0A3M7RU12_BRAPC|nr:hypothetical protein BpHYR1_038877 [Brachionus plicatilis]